MIIPDDERNKFISLREALTLIARQRKLDPLTRSGMQEAARTLAQSLSKHPLYQELDLLSYDDLEGTTRLCNIDKKSFKNILKELVRGEKTNDIPF